MEEDLKQDILWRHFRKFFKAVSKLYILMKQQYKVLNLELCIYFKAKNLIYRHFFSKLDNLANLVKSVSWVNKRPNFYIIIQLQEFQCFKIVILWPIPNPRFWRHSKTGSKVAQICISNTVCEKRLKSIGTEANFQIFKTLTPVIKSLKQNLVIKDLNLYIMYQQW